MNRAVSLVMELENNITEKVTCTFNKVWFKIRVYKKWLSKISDRSLYIVRIVISDTEQEGTRSSNSCNISGETIRSPGRCSFDNAHVKPLWTMKESPLPPSKKIWKIYKTRHPRPPPLNWKRNLYTVHCTVYKCTQYTCTLTLLSVYLKPRIKKEPKSRIWSQKRSEV